MDGPQMLRSEDVGLVRGGVHDVHELAGNRLLRLRRLGLGVGGEVAEQRRS